MRCIDFQLLLIHIAILLVNEDGEDRWMAGDIGDETRVIDRHTISSNGIILSDGQLREGRPKRLQEVKMNISTILGLVLKTEANRGEYQSEFAVVLLCELDCILFDSTERCDRLLLAQVNESLDPNNAKRVLVFKLLLDLIGIFFSCAINPLVRLLISISTGTHLKTFEFCLNKDVRSQEAHQVVHVEQPEGSHCL